MLSKCLHEKLNYAGRIVSCFVLVKFPIML